MNSSMAGAGMLLALVNLLVVVSAIVVVLVSLWRGMRAQEEMSRTLNRIQQSLSRWSPPPGS